MLGQVPIYSGCAFISLFNGTKINAVVLAVHYLLWYVQHVSFTFSVCYSDQLLAYFIACKRKVVYLDAEEKKGMQSCCNCVFE